MEADAVDPVTPGRVAAGRAAPLPRAIAAAGASLALFGLSATGAAAQTVGPFSAEGDSYAVGAQAFVLGTNLSKTPIQVGPVAPAVAQVPPGTDASANSGTVTFNSAGAQPALDFANVTGDTAKATLGRQPSTGCVAPAQALTAGFQNGPLTGGNACASVAQVGALNSGTAQVPADALQAAAVEAQSLTQSCTATPLGFVNIARLSVGGQDVIGGASPLVATNTPAPNTIVPLVVGTLILNEQHYDNHGHGLTVNAIHLFTGTDIGQLAAVDLVIGHAHSEALCAQGTTDTGGLPGAGGSMPGAVPVVTKTDSTKSANPGETVTYSISIDPKVCAVTRVTDLLPPGFTYVSASGLLGTPTVSTVPGTQQQQQLDWFNPTGFTTPTAGAPLTETVVARISPTEPNGMYVNNVAGQSSPPAGTSGCGAFEGSDLLPLTTGPADNQGQNPGIIVPRPTPATPAPTPAAAVPQTSIAPSAGPGLANTGASVPGATSGIAVAAVLGVGLVLVRRRRTS